MNQIRETLYAQWAVANRALWRHKRRCKLIDCHVCPVLAERVDTTRDAYELASVVNPERFAQ